MSDTPDTDKRREEILREYGGIGEGAFAALYWYAQSEERELTALRAKLAEAEKDAERKDSALRVARAAVTLGTTDGGKAVVRLIDAAIEKERGNV